MSTFVQLKVPNSCGTLIINSSGGILYSSGDLENDEDISKKFFAIALRLQILLKKSKAFYNFEIYFKNHIYSLTCVGENIFVNKQKNLLDAIA